MPTTHPCRKPYHSARSIRHFIPPTGFPPLPTGIKKVSAFHRENGDKESKFQF